MGILAFVVDAGNFVLDWILVVKLGRDGHGGWAVLMAFMLIVALLMLLFLRKGAYKILEADASSRFYVFTIMICEYLTFLIEDATTIFIYLRADGAYDPKESSDVLNLFFSASSAGLQFIFFFMYCLSDANQNATCRGAWDCSCFFSSICLYLALAVVSGLYAAPAGYWAYMAIFRVYLQRDNSASTFIQGTRTVYILTWIYSLIFIVGLCFGNCKDLFDSNPTTPTQTQEENKVDTEAGLETSDPPEEQNESFVDQNDRGSHELPAGTGPTD